MEFIYIGIIVFLFFLAVMDLVVGVSNDAVNFLNSAVGAKTAKFKTIIVIATAGVFLGAIMSNGMMDIARHGIYQPQFFTFAELMCIMLAVMVTDVLLLDTFNTMGMPTSTTVSLVFELLGGTVALALIKSITSDGALTFAQMLNTDKALSVVLGIFLSIAIAFFFGMVVQWITRLIFTFNYKKNLKWFAGIFGGIAVTSILYFMVIKGLKDSSFMTPENMAFVKENTSMILLAFFVGSTLLMQILHWCKINIFKIIVLIGTFALAMAFAGNDLVNFIGVPLAGLSALQDFNANGTSVGADAFMMESLTGSAKTPVLYLIIAGAIMVFALITSKKAKNVINTSVSLSKQDDSEQMFGTSAVARRLVQVSRSMAQWFIKITPAPVKRWIDTRFNKDEIILEEGAAFDQLRAAVNLVMAAMLIALGTSLKLPLSTTFVTFMVAMGTSLADRAWSRESAVFRVTGMISVIGGWLLTAVAAFIFCFAVTMAMHFGGIVVMVVLAVVALIIIIRSNFIHKEAKENKEDDVFAEIVNTDDPQVVWSLMKQHVEKNILNQIEYTSVTYTQFVDALLDENRKGLKKLQSSLSTQMLTFKTTRRKEIIALKKCDPMITLQANTWFHISANNTIQMMYALKRVIEPCKDHIENNFNPLPNDCRDNLQIVRKSLIELFDKGLNYSESLKKGNTESPAAIIREISTFKSAITQTLDQEMIRLRGEQSNTNISTYMLYQTILQESQQMADSLKHLLRAYYKLYSIK
ncbi:MAG: inorganic phosphate transporter [Bacteroidales bacterium]|nr:inorganic phosphate transporter [Bacteroidales bacterium]